MHCRVRCWWGKTRGMSIYCFVFSTLVPSLFGRDVRDAPDLLRVAVAIDISVCVLNSCRCLWWAVDGYLYVGRSLIVTLVYFHQASMMGRKLPRFQFHCLLFKNRAARAHNKSSSTGHFYGPEISRFGSLWSPDRTQPSETVC